MTHFRAPRLVEVSVAYDVDDVWRSKCRILRRNIFLLPLRSTPPPKEHVVDTEGYRAAHPILAYLPRGTR